MKLWVPVSATEFGDAYIPPEAKAWMYHAMVHEAGHAQVALHFNVKVFGIALQHEGDKIRPSAIYAIPRSLGTKSICTIYAAGSAAEVIKFGEYSEESASGDLLQLREEAGDVAYPPLVQRAKRILEEERKSAFNATIRLLQQRVESSIELKMARLHNGVIGAYLLLGNELPAA